MKNFYMWAYAYNMANGGSLGADAGAGGSAAEGAGGSAAETEPQFDIWSWSPETYAMVSDQLVKSFDKEFVVYFGIVAPSLLKIGESRGNLDDRRTHHVRVFGRCDIVYVIRCTNTIGLETYLKQKLCRHHEPYFGSTEVFKVGPDTIPFRTIIKMAEKAREHYNGMTPADMIRMRELDNERARIAMEDRRIAADLEIQRIKQQMAQAAPIAPAVQAAPIAPAVQAAPIAPAVQAAPIAPAVQAAPIAPAVQAAPIAPAVQAAPIAPAVQAAPIAPAVQAAPIAPAVQAAPIAPAVQAAPHRYNVGKAGVKLAFAPQSIAAWVNLWRAGTESKVASSFDPTVALQIMRIFKPKRVLDFNMGYGDKLLAAIAAEGVWYTGIEANRNLFPGYIAMVQDLVPTTDERMRYSLLNGRAEGEWQAGQCRVDMCFTSPDVGKGDDAWFEDYLFKALRNAWRVLVTGGHMVVHLNDTRQRPVTVHMNSFIEKELPNARYVGCIGMQNATGVDSLRGLLVWHSTGTGKTCAAAGIMDAFAHTGKNMFYVTTFQGLRSNNVASFTQCAEGLFPRLAADMTATPARYHFTTIRKFANAVSGREFSPNSEVLRRKEALEDSVIILDEIHKLFDPKALDGPFYREAQAFLLSMRHRHPNIVVVLMTATPGRNVTELCDLFNMIRDPEQPEVTFADPDRFAEQVRGFVSYVDISKDRNIFPAIVETEEEVQLGEQQEQAYLERLARDDLTGCRKYCNSLFLKKPGMDWRQFSCKVHAIGQRLLSASGAKHYVYSCFYGSHGMGGHGIRGVAAFLEENGYTQLRPSDVVGATKQSVRAMPPARRYILLTNRDVSDGSSSEKVEADNLRALMMVANHPANRDGGLVHAVLASQGYNEAVDLHAVQYVHIMEPQLDLLDETQAIGRAARRCSHKDLPRDSQLVQVIRYLACRSVDKHQHSLQALAADLELATFLHGLRNSSVTQREVQEARQRLLDAHAKLREYQTTDHFVRHSALEKYAAMQQALSIVKASSVTGL
ncbi:hypothetical protein HXX76_014132 [Chlamydomonas incerta]|uniref:Helicase ATP-binding domain-containing protein n=1 Tax=Chlamydomonas incerta TaxID=51695 RepID=A0A835SDI2_CHLIN|nr:hypothetical protein HXX76_014132 [Chlamydomonas incerta]|eukprot:KAG2424974.1 hypothetical protein HXX76_014132 [Chlamydomonas incerta]